MKKLGQFFTHPTTIAVIGLILFALLVWFAGPTIKFGEDNRAPLADAMVRLLVIMAAVMLWVLVGWLRQLNNNKSNKALVLDLKQSSHASLSETLNEQAADEVAMLSERFETALATLNTLNFRDKGRKKALYQLPWYIIVGPPGSGKTTTLINSGLEFPLADSIGKGALQGVGGTRNCDWWFTNEAVLIDTAGRYTTQDSHKVVDGGAWEGFLDLLKRNRRRRPINGAIVAVSLLDLLTQTEEERQLHAKTIRTRLDELMTKLEIRFPIYMMFTKSDLVSGFSEFFEDLSREDREQVWGVSLPNASKPSQAPDFAFLQQQFSGLVDRLNERVLFRMHSERDSRRCAAIEGFPLQMQNAMQLAEDFVKRAFMQNRFQMQPYLRGVYFSSGTQDGTPIDRLMTSISANFGFAREQAPSNTNRGRSYFIERLFREVIFPESELVGTNQRYERWIRITRNVTYAAAAALTVGVLLLWSGSVTRSNMYMNEVQQDLAAFSEESARITRGTANEKNLIDALNALKRASEVYDKDAHPMLAGLGLYDDSVDQGANRLYHSKLRSILIPHLLKEIEANLRSGSVDKDLYTDLRLYMMFALPAKMDKPALSDWFNQHWQARFSEDSQDLKDLQQHLQTLLTLEFKPSSLNTSLVAQTRSLLLSIPVAQRIYRRIKSDPQFNQPINLLDQLGDSARNVFALEGDKAANLQLPLLFTQQGYKALDLSAGSPLFALVGDDEWVLADADQGALTALIDDPKTVSRDVKNLYLNDYAAVWSQLLNDLTVKRFSSLQELSSALRTLADPMYSPLLSVLDVTKLHTQLTPPLLEDIAAKAKLNERNNKAVDFAQDKIPVTLVDQRFAPLHRQVTGSERSPAPINASITQLAALNSFMQEIAMAPDVGQQAFATAKARYQAGAGNVISQTRGYARGAPEPVARWLTSLSDESWRLVSQAAHGHIASQWRSRVYQPYAQALAGRYPLNPAASDELAMLDFATFFKPGGTLEQFEQEFVAPFIEKRGDWQSRGVDGASLGFSSNALKQLALGAKIREVYFKRNPETPSIDLELRPFYMNNQDAIFTLDMGNQRLSYNHGPKFWKAISWSDQDDARRIRLIFEDLHGGQFDRAFTGPWAWFRLIDSAKIEATTQSNIYKITFMHESAERDSQSPRKITFEGRATSVHNPFKNDLLQHFRCPETL